ncbi:MAG: CinA family protein, partial [Burkholderiales bacterium]
YGIGESHADTLLAGVETLVPDGNLKLGFRAHYPQLETKLTVRGTDMEDIRRKLAPAEKAVRQRLGNFILGEDDQKLETVVLGELARHQATLATVETFTGGTLAARVSHLAGAEKLFRRGIVTRDLAQLCAITGLDAKQAGFTLEFAQATARATRQHSGATHALAVLIELDEGADRIEFGGSIFIAIATEKEGVTRHSRMLGGREWVRLGAVEMALDCLRRYLQGLPVDERIDFEKT